MSGTVHGVGLGPGSPDLMSVRADRLVRGARQVAYFRKAGRQGQARRIVEGMLRADAVEIPMDYPVTTEIPLSDPRYAEALAAFYQDCAAHLRALAEAGEEVIVLCEGDPFFYGSFMHLHSRLTGHVPVQVVPAITGMSAAWTATGMPITWGDDVLTVAPATLSEDELTRRIAQTDALVVMKIGQNLAKLKRAIAAAGRMDAAWLVEYAAMPEQ
ncbi:MAG: precorrin-2 C(20)-methyltransferase, partial [Pararhodobacter sp.]|nr:precorrin-2 C(20)-methyltransferase [Pararhodobacter sp.]